jgi:hypothetical protein
MVQLHLADPGGENCPGGREDSGDNVGSVNVNKGAVSISVGRVLVVCQFGHIVVPQTIVASTTCPRVVKAQLQDHVEAVEPEKVFGMTRAHFPYASLVGVLQLVAEDVLLCEVEVEESIQSRQ